MNGFEVTRALKAIRARRRRHPDDGQRRGARRDPDPRDRRRGLLLHPEAVRPARAADAGEPLPGAPRAARGARAVPRARRARAGRGAAVPAQPVAAPPDGAARPVDRRTVPGLQRAGRGHLRLRRGRRRRGGPADRRRGRPRRLGGHDDRRGQGRLPRVARRRLRADRRDRSGQGGHPRLRPQPVRHPVLCPRRSRRGELRYVERGPSRADLCDTATSGRSCSIPRARSSRRPCSTSPASR